MLSCLGLSCDWNSAMLLMPCSGSAPIASAVTKIEPPINSTVWIVSVTTTALRPPSTVYMPVTMEITRIDVTTSIPKNCSNTVAPAYRLIPM